MSFERAILFSFIPVGLISVCFMISSQINHLSPDNVDVSDRDYWKHQVVTSHSLATHSWWVYLFTGGLNLQIEHHLFPTVNHCHHRELQPMVKEICQKHGVYYHESMTLREALGKYYQHMVEYGVKPSE